MHRTFTHRMSKDEVTIHNTSKVRNITFNKAISDKLLDLGCMYCTYYLDYRVNNFDERRVWIYFRKKSLNNIPLKKYKSNACVKLCSSAVTRSICQYFNIEQGSYYAHITLYRENEEGIVYTIDKITLNRKITEIEPTVCVDTESQPKEKSLLDFTDKQLYDELKRRGYEGKLSITKILE